MIERLGPGAGAAASERADTRRRAARILRGAAIAAALLSLSATQVALGARMRSLPVSVAVATANPGAAVPPAFLGLSFEVASLPQLADYAESGDLVTLLRSLGPGVLRFGGVTADRQVAWTDAATPRPAWALSVLEAGDLQRLASLAARSGWHVLLTIGLAHYEPQAAAREAAAAQAALGPWLAGIELGNEPNAYAHQGFRSEPWTFVQYSAQVSGYRSAIEAAAPGVPLAGPDSSGSAAFEAWGLGEAINQQPALLTGHHYPLGCEQVPAPTITRLLSPRIRGLAAISLRNYVSISQASMIPFRLDETNTVSCGGTPGISNTFASALWAVGYLLQAMSAGVSGINLQGNPDNCPGYTPICAPTPETLASGELAAQPEWYALLLARELIGDRPVEAVMRTPPRLNVEVDALLAQDGSLHVVIVDDDPAGRPSATVKLRVGSDFHGASVLTLTAPSLTAQSGVTLGGRAVAAGGTWQPPRRLPHYPNRDGVITLSVRPASAALATISPK